MHFTNLWLTRVFKVVAGIFLRPLVSIDRFIMTRFNVEKSSALSSTPVIGCFQ